MSEKIIIVKNNTTSDIAIETLGLIVETGQESSLNSEDLLEINNTDELLNLINSGDLIINDGTNDLTPPNAIKYLSILDISDYYNKEETNDLLDNKANLDHNHDDRYYTEAEVDERISNVSGYGIIGAVNTYDDLPESSTNVGDIYIVRQTTGVRTGDPSNYQANSNTSLYLSFNGNITDLSHNHFVGTIIGNLTFDTSNTNSQCAVFDGNTHISFRPHGDLGENTPFTYAAWIYKTENCIAPIVDRWDNYHRKGFRCEFHNNKLRHEITTNNNYKILFDNSQISLNEWYHIGVTFDGSIIRLYKNGIIINSVYEAGNYIEGIQTINLLIGGSNNSDNRFCGKMHSFFFERRVLEQDEFEILCNGSPFTSYHYEGFYRWNGEEWEWLAHNTGGARHNDLSGLNEGDYKHLTNDEYISLTNNENCDIHKHDNIYYTRIESDNLLNLKSNVGHNHDDRYYTKNEIEDMSNEINYSFVSNNDPDTNITASELEQLTNGSNCDNLHTHSGMGGSGSLDDAYNNGRQINVDAGSIKLISSNGHAPLELVPTSVPTQNLSAGMLTVYENELFLYDSSRNKWLSVSQLLIGAGLNQNNVRNKYLQSIGRVPFSSRVGWLAPWNGTIVSIMITSNCSTNNIMKIRLNGHNLNGASLSYNNDKKQYDNSINADFNANDVLSFYIEGYNCGTNRPICWAIVKKRIYKKVEEKINASKNN